MGLYIKLVWDELRENWRRLAEDDAKRHAEAEEALAARAATDPVETEEKPPKEGRRK